MEEGQSLILTDEEIIRLFHALPSNKTYPLKHSETVTLGITAKGKEITVRRVNGSSIFMLGGEAISRFRNFCFELVGGKFLIVEQKTKAMPFYAFLTKAQIVVLIKDVLYDRGWSTHFTGFPFEEEKNLFMKWKEARAKELVARTGCGLYLTCFFSKVRKKPYAALVDAIKGKISSFPLDVPRLFDVKDGRTYCLRYENGRFLKSALDTQGVLHFIYPQSDKEQKKVA